MTSLALLVLLDAFRPDYLVRTHFLRDLSRRSGTGAMEEPFGFLTRAPYFAGMSPRDTGYSSIFAREPWRSPFPAVPGLEQVRSAVGEQSLRPLFEAEARRRLPDYGRRYLESHAIPLEHVANYAIAESVAPWDAACGYRSLFQILDEAGIRWMQCSWPYTRSIPGFDGAYLGRFLENLTSETGFAFLHLSQLDAAGHAFGPGSVEVQATLDELDRLCAHLYTSVLERFDRVRILFFGDHGMVTVVRHVDLLQALAAAGCTPGDGFDVFLDSPMARFWFWDTRQRTRVENALASLDCGRTLTPAELAAFRAWPMAPGNGDAIFVAHPGVLFVPNSFQARPVRGMHGYLPDVPDNRGVLLLHDSAARVGGLLGIADARSLYPSCLEMCGLDPAEYTELPPLRVTPESRRWTVSGKPAHEALVERHLRVATRALEESAPASAVIVAGSFGRGEGGVVQHAAGAPMPLNDYDFAVIGPTANDALPLANVLARSLGMDFCDVLPFRAPHGLAPSQLHFDLRYGSTVLAGDPLTLDRMPSYAPAEIPADDALLLLINRVCGIMLVPMAQQDGRTPHDQFAVNQLVKALIALGDARLIAIGDYSTRYGDRAARFESLSRGLRVDAAAAARIVAAYHYKLSPVPAPGPFDAGDFQSLRADFRVALRELGPANADDPNGFQAAVRTALIPVADPEADDRESERRLRELEFAPVLAGGAQEPPVLRRAILEGMLQLFFATGKCPISAGQWSDAQGALALIGAPAARVGSFDAPGCTEIVRQQLAAAWLAVCHG